MPKIKQFGVICEGSLMPWSGFVAASWLRVSCAAWTLNRRLRNNFVSHNFIMLSSEALFEELEKKMLVCARDKLPVIRVQVRAIKLYFELFCLRPSMLCRVSRLKMAMIRCAMNSNVCFKLILTSLGTPDCFSRADAGIVGELPSTRLPSHLLLQRWCCSALGMSLLKSENKLFWSSRSMEKVKEERRKRRKEGKEKWKTSEYGIRANTKKIAFRTRSH